MRKLIIAMTIAAPAAASAGGYAIPDPNPRDLALAQAAVANQTGAEAVLLNTAALAGQLGLDVSAAGQLLLNRTTWSDPQLGTADLLTQPNTPPALAVSYGDTLPRDMAWGVGAAFGLPAGGSLVWPDGWQGQEAVQSVDQKVFVFSFGAAFQPLKYLKLGASVLRYQAQEELHQSINYLDHYGDAGIALAGGATTFGVAAQLDVPNLPLSIAVTYRHASDVMLEGDAHFTAVPPAFQTLIHDQGVKGNLPVPHETFVGAAYAVRPNVKVMAAYNLEGWNIYETDTFVGDSGFTVVVPRNYEDAYVLRLAGEWDRMDYLPALALRAGILRSISPQPTDTVSPSLTDGDSWAVSIGAGYDVLDGLRVDLGYQHAIFDKVTATGMDAFPGSYETSADLISLGVNWRHDFVAREVSQ